MIYAQANTVFRKCALLWRDVIASSQSDVLYDALLSASLEILQRLDLRYDERMLEDEMRCRLSVFTELEPDAVASMSSSWSHECTEAMSRRRPCHTGQKTSSTRSSSLI